jgi:hypothetical protein
MTVRSAAKWALLPATSAAWLVLVGLEVGLHMAGTALDVAVGCVEQLAAWLEEPHA